MSRSYYVWQQPEPGSCWEERGLVEAETQEAALAIAAGENTGGRWLALWEPDTRFRVHDSGKWSRETKLVEQQAEAEPEPEPPAETTHEEPHDDAQQRAQPPKAKTTKRRGRGRAKAAR
jgi:hypothetical protein